MKLIGDFELVCVGDETMAVPVGDCTKQFNCVIHLNDSAAEIFEMLKSDISEDEIVDALTAKYENEREEIASFVGDILKEFSENGILSE